VELNEELKAKERWNDPAAGFLKNVCITKLIKGGVLLEQDF